VLAQTDICIVRPERVITISALAREPEWAARIALLNTPFINAIRY
jgi:hypothetical protein